MTTVLRYDIDEIEPYINWIYFYHAWGLSGKPESEKAGLRADAETMLAEFKNRYHTHAVFGLFPANSDGDDIIIDGVRVPFLRQQTRKTDGSPNLCMADFIRPLSLGKADRIGVFATTVDAGMEKDYCDDDYLKIMSKTLADRLAEATAEKMHEEVRRHYWGYAADENLSIPEMLNAAYCGIRPAVGYPSMPDISINFILSELVGMSEIGIRLTVSGAMQPHASVSGLMIAHPRASYFDVGPIGEDQLADYASRRGIPVRMMRRFLSASL